MLKIWPILRQTKNRKYLTFSLMHERKTYNAVVLISTIKVEKKWNFNMKWAKELENNSSFV